MRHMVELEGLPNVYADPKAFKYVGLKNGQVLEVLRKKRLREWHAARKAEQEAVDGRDQRTF